MKFLIEFVQNYWDHAVGVVLLLSIFFEITPIKVNPLSAILKWIGSITTEEVCKEVAAQNEKLDNFIKETKEDSQAMMRDRLTQMYHFTLKRGYLLEKDSENFNRLYERYIANGGNSYIVHDVEPRMHTFHVYLSDEDAQKHYDEYGEY